MKTQNRILIDVKEGVVDDLRAIAAVMDVIRAGRISENAKGIKHYCWHTSFTDGVQVSVRAKRKNQKSDSFIVWRDDQ